MKNGLRALAFISIPFFYKLPAAVFVYMAFSSLLTLLQIVVLRMPAVKRYFGIPTLDPGMAPQQRGMLKVRPLTIQEARKYLDPNPSVNPNNKS